MQIKTLSAKQRKIMEFISSDDMALVCDGSVRSGKTTVMSMAFVLWAMQNEFCNLREDGAGGRAKYLKTVDGN